MYIVVSLWSRMLDKLIDHVTAPFLPLSDMAQASYLLVQHKVVMHADPTSWIFYVVFQIKVCSMRLMRLMMVLVLVSMGLNIGSTLVSLAGTVLSLCTSLQ